MRLILLAAALACGSPAGATCYSDKTCLRGCCEQTGLGSSCWCSTCCLGRSGAEDETAQLYWGANKAAAVYLHRVEFFDLRGRTFALIDETGKTRALRDEAAAYGRPAFLGKDGKPVAVKPRSVRTFQEGIYPYAVRKAKQGVFIVCTSPEWGVSSSTAAEKNFCGAFALDGSTAFKLDGAQTEVGIVREPVGMADDGREALFALTKKRADGGREVVGYRLWQRGRAETLPPDGARAKALIERYEGPFVLPSQQKGSGGN